MSPLRFLGALALSLCVTAPAHAQTDAPRLEGRYRLRAGQPSIDRAIDAVCEELDAFTRVIARPILEDRNRPYRTIELDVDARRARFAFDDWGPVESRLGATRTLPNARGETSRLRQLLVGRRLVQTLSTDEGTRRNVITWDADGRRLTVETLITSPRLPIPMRYRLVYERIDGPDARLATR